MRYIYSSWIFPFTLILLFALNILFSITVAQAEDHPDDYMWLNGFGFNNFVGSEIRNVELDSSIVYTILGNKLSRYDINNYQWSVLASLTSGTINDLFVNDTNVYFVGSFKEVNGKEIWGVANYNSIDKQINQVGGKIYGQVNCIVSDKPDRVIIGGTEIDNGESKSSLFYLENDVWIPISDQIDGTIHALELRGDSLYFAGQFEVANNQFINNLAIWDMRTKEIMPFSGNIDGIIMDIELLLDDDVVIGGIIAEIDQKPYSNIAYWDGDTWDDLDGGTDGSVYTIRNQNDGEINLLIGGRFDRVGKKFDVVNFAQFNGKWSDSNYTFGNNETAVFDIAVSKDIIAISGSFANVGNENIRDIALLKSGTKIDPFKNNKNGVSSLIHDFTVGKDSKLYVGGGFNNVGSENSPGFAAWTGFDWESLNGGLYAPAVVYDVESFEDDIYFSGWFPGADGVKMNNIAKWNFVNRNYHGIGDGIDAEDGDMGPIIFLKDTLYAGGRFILHGNEDSHGIAKWNNFEWEGVKTGIKSDGTYTPSVNALASDDVGMLYVGGRFDSAGIEYAKGLAIWNPYLQRWYGFMNALEGTVHTILYTNDYVYLGGEITEVYSQEANNLVRLDWRSMIWEPIGKGTNGPIYSIVEYDGSLYIGGVFSRAGDTDANSIVRYDLTMKEFYPMGSGIIDTYRSGTVLALQVFRDKLFVGGLFNTAGGKYSNNIAVWDGLLTSVEKTNNEVHLDASIVPNPVRHSSIVQIQLPNMGTLSAGIYDFNGDLILQLAEDENYYSGNIELEFNTEKMNSSVYFCKIFFDGNVITKKILVIK